MYKQQVIMSATSISTYIYTLTTDFADWIGRMRLGRSGSRELSARCLAMATFQYVLVSPRAQRVDRCATPLKLPKSSLLRLLGPKLADLAPGLWPTVDHEVRALSAGCLAASI